MTRPLRPCGTTAAYARHLRNGEQACDACKAAHAAKSAAYRADVRRITQRGAELATIYQGIRRRRAEREAS